MPECSNQKPLSAAKQSESVIYLNTEQECYSGCLPTAVNRPKASDGDEILHGATEAAPREKMPT